MKTDDGHKLDIAKGGKKIVILEANGDDGLYLRLANPDARGDIIARKAREKVRAAAKQVREKRAEARAKIRGQLALKSGDAYRLRSASRDRRSCA